MRKTETLGKKSKKTPRMLEIWRQLRKNKLAVAGLVILVALLLTAVFADVIAPYDYSQQDASASFAPASAEHLLGCDRFGRDTLSRLIYGARTSLAVAGATVTIAALIGIIFGAVAGYFGGWVDNLLMRFFDIYQSIPQLLMAIVLTAILGQGLVNCVIAIVLTSMPMYARLMRSSILSVRESEYVEAAKTINGSNFRIILKHIIPNAIAPMIVFVSLQLGQAILFCSTLSFIGLGAQSPTAEWGCMVSEGRNFLRDHGELVLYPGLCIMLAVLSLNLLGDGLRDALDPRLKN